jgi:hypothetical protein
MRMGSEVGVIFGVNLPLRARRRPGPRFTRNRGGVGVGEAGRNAEMVGPIGPDSPSSL